MLALFAIQTYSQGINTQVPDPRLGMTILLGNCDRSGLESGEFGTVFSEYYSIYEPDKTVVAELKKLTDGASILIVLGTWCSDSQEQVPRFFKILDKIRFDRKEVRVICVNSDKEAGDVDLSGLDIRKVPTFVIYRNGREAGRIIETPYATLEKDLLMFFRE
jgi:thiol-disulfide isomerase/thioredoxin